MTDLQPLLILLGQHDKQRDAARLEHQRAVAAAVAAEAQAAQLADYRREYEQRWKTEFAREGKIEVVHCYQSFNQRLSLAVDQQAHAVKIAAAQAEHAMTRLAEAEMRCASVRKLIERRTLEQRLAADRREQKQSDEFAARSAWNRVNASGPSSPH